MAEAQEAVRKFRVKVDNVTLPGAGMSPGVASGRPIAYVGETVTSDELGSHLTDLYDGGDEWTRALFEEFDAGEGPEAAELEKSDVQGDEPWEGYDSTSAKEVVERLKEMSPEVIEAVKQYESLRTQPRKTVLEFEPEAEAEEEGGSEQ